MKNQTDLTSLTLEELQKRVKIAKTATGLLAGIVFVQFAVGLYLTVKQGFNVFTVIPICFLPLVIVNSAQIKKLNEEIAKRKV